MTRQETFGARRMVRRDPNPRIHAELARDLRSRIRDGALSVGERLPTERAIAEAERVSRGTVREALRLLERDGLIERRQGSGTTVIARSPRSYVQPLDSLETLLRYPDDTEIRLAGTEAVVTTDTHLEECGLPADGTWMRLDLRRFARGSTAPVSQTFAYCPADFAATATEIDGSASPIVRLVERKLGRSAVRVDLRMDAVATPEALSDVLDVPPRAPALRLVRSYRDDRDHVLQVSVTTHPAGRYAFAASLEI